MDAIWSFLITAFVLTGSPGPNTLSVSAVGATFGRKQGLGYMAGLNLGVGLVILIVGSGISGAMLALPGVKPVITGLAIAYFLYLAFRIATAPPLSHQSGQHVTSAPRWFEGVFLSLANPKAYAAMAALFSGHVLVENHALLDGIWKAALAMVVIIIVNFCWLLTGTAMARFLQDPRISRLINITFATLLLLSVVIVALT